MKKLTHMIGVAVFTSIVWMPVQAETRAVTPFAYPTHEQIQAQFKAQREAANKAAAAHRAHFKAMIKAHKQAFAAIQPRVPFTAQVLSVKDFETQQAQRVQFAEQQRAAIQRAIGARQKAVTGYQLVTLPPFVKAQHDAAMKRFDEARKAMDARRDELRKRIKTRRDEVRKDFEARRKAFEVRHKAAIDAFRTGHEEA